MFLKGEYIIHEGDIGSKMYFILSGVVSILKKDRDIKTQLSDGAHFGEICLLAHDRRVATVRADTICDTFSLSKKNFEFILREYPAMKCALEEIAQSRLHKLGKKLKSGRLSTPVSPPSMSRGSNSPPSTEEQQLSTWKNIRRHLLKLKKRGSRKNRSIQEDIKTVHTDSENSEHMVSSFLPAALSPIQSTDGPLAMLPTSTHTDVNDAFCEHNESSSQTVLEELFPSNSAEVPLNVSDTSYDSECDSSEEP